MFCAFTCLSYDKKSGPYRRRCPHIYVPADKHVRRLGNTNADVPCLAYLGAEGWTFHAQHQRKFLHWQFITGSLKQQGMESSCVYPTHTTYIFLLRFEHARFLSFILSVEWSVFYLDLWDWTLWRESQQTTVCMLLMESGGVEKLYSFIKAVGTLNNVLTRTSDDGKAFFFWWHWERHITQLWNCCWRVNGSQCHMNT